MVHAIKLAEKQTSGEIRVFVESRCRFVNPLDRATEVFSLLKMDATKERNAVLVYVAMKDRQLAVFGDEGIYQRVGAEYWNNAVKEMIASFTKDNISNGIEKCVQLIGETLKTEFPYNAGTDKNELPDDIVFGK